MNPTKKPTPWHIIFPGVVIAVFLVYLVAQAVPPKQENKECDLAEFGRLPVLDDGRIKPLDSVARTKLLFISGRSEFKDEKGNAQPAIRWLIDIMAHPEGKGPAAEYRVFRIDNEQVLSFLELEERPGSYRYSLKELGKTWDKLGDAINSAMKLDPKKRDLFHDKIIELSMRINTYTQLTKLRTPTVVPLKRESDEWISLADVDAQVRTGLHDAAAEAAKIELQQEMKVKGLSPDDVSPARLQAEYFARIQSKLYGMVERERGSVHPAAGAFGDILRAYRDNKPTAYREAIQKYCTEYAYPLNPEFRDVTGFEWWFNAFAPFYHGAFLYVFAGTLAALSWLGWSKPFHRAAMGLALLALVLNIFGLLGRMYLMDRPLVFVTNLYSSALMIGCAAVGCCLLVERLFKNGIGLVVGTTIGATTVAIAHHLSTDGKDTLGTLVAVLDTNFWLASHVTTVTLGYSATYIAGLMGVVYIGWGLFTTTLTREKSRTIGKMIYGIVCFATFLSFVGTVLGGIWADQSWGRFWGWDPKENGAVQIVIWNSLILHARWAGLVRERGLAVLSVVGIMMTTWSWFGTNQLEAGLHNYGFNKSLAEGCRYTWIVCMSIIVGGLIPRHFWRSDAALTGTATTLVPPPATTSESVPPIVPVSTPAMNGQQNGQHPTKGKGKKAGKRR